MNKLGFYEQTSLEISIFYKDVRDPGRERFINYSNSSRYKGLRFIKRPYFYKAVLRRRFVALEIASLSRCIINIINFYFVFECELLFLL